MCPLRRAWPFASWDCLSDPSSSSQSAEELTEALQAHILYCKMLGQYHGSCHYCLRCWKSFSRPNVKAPEHPEGPAGAAALSLVLGVNLKPQVLAAMVGGLCETIEAPGQHWSCESQNLPKRPLLRSPQADDRLPAS